MSRPVWRPQHPWNGLPALQKSVAAFETVPVLRRCIRSRAALAELKQAAERFPNQAVLIGTIPLLEAQASSAIENIVTTQDQLFRLQRAEDVADPAAKEALRYRHALLEGFATLRDRPLTTATAEAVCGRIRGVETRVRPMAGTTLANPATGEVVYTPPEGEDRLRRMLAAWERYPNEPSELDPLIRMAAGHHQFEAIHPFHDGNGRTGRILNSLFLIQEELLTLPVLYLSRYIIAHKAEYYGLLLEVTRSAAWEPWILYMLRGVEETAIWTTAKIGGIRRLFDETVEHVRATVPRTYRHELIVLLFEQPYLRIQNLFEAGIAQRQAASRQLRQLVDAGVLREVEAGREKLFLNPRLMRLLTSDSNGWTPFPGPAGR
ncbi:Fic family protein [Phycisphaera mikurensis]|uniref:Fido domain-containing protein n=1 Tax=Phycisphaera mikurensis (strain NBRC 102666 / KCTC 22515 / FYK2301M01) TaxID=1142394 RepID=I0IBU9_PHYMF|nr:hypothetical protein PSMK_05780 [Phycisphaera mikurensis NBRC 102666]